MEFIPRIDNVDHVFNDDRLLRGQYFFLSVFCIKVKHTFDHLISNSLIRGKPLIQSWE